MYEENYRRTMEDFAQACRKAGRQPEDGKLIAVSKTWPAESVARVYALGQRLFGENRARELTEKQPVLPKDIAWHFIGRLQRNKVKYIIDKTVMIHSVDSPALAEEISRRALEKRIEAQVLVQVNLGGEEAKAGFEKDALRQGLVHMAGLPGLRVRGLMTIGPYYAEAEDTRPLFRGMRMLKEEAASWEIPGIDMRFLSMGMSHDYCVAIEEGADFVRVGSAIFGRR